MRVYTGVFSVILLAAAMASLASASETNVGNTKDACDKSNPVKLESSTGTVSVGANSTKSVSLPARTTEIFWYCGGSRERSANDKEFNNVKISRAANGAIQWTFFLIEGENTLIPLVRVGDSRDACDGSQPVTFNSKTEQVTVKAGQIVLEELPMMSGDMSWQCGKSNERVANPNAFDVIQAERASNGALQWVFYRTLTDHDDSTGNYIDLLPGDLVLQLAGTSTTVSQPGFLKLQLDTLWASQRGQFQAKMLAKLKKEKSFTVQSLTLSDASKSEVRIGDDKDDVLVKYVVHENELLASSTGANLRAVFDLELVMVLPKQQTMPLQAKRATAFAHHFEIHAASAGDAILAAFAKSRIHAVETDTDSSTQDVKKDVNTALASVSGNLGAPSGSKVGLQQTNGTVQACVQLKAGAKCSFPAVSRVVAPNRKTLDTSHDQCSEAKVWMWDYQKGGFVSIAKGGSAEIEVDNQRFEWFCGGDSQPDTVNGSEWATGPEGTYFVHVQRDATGRNIDWTFQSWH